MPVQTIIDGSRNVVVKIAATGVEAETAVDVSALNPPCTRVNVTRIWYTCLDANAITLVWESTADELLARLHGQQDYCFEEFGGLTNPDGPGATGNILYATPDGGCTIILHCTKHGVIDTPL